MPTIVCLNYTGELIIACHDMSRITLWNSKTNVKLDDLYLPRIISIAISPVDNRFAVACLDGSLYSGEIVDDSKLQKTWDAKNSTWVIYPSNTVEYSADGAYVTHASNEKITAYVSGTGVVHFIIYLSYDRLDNLLSLTYADIRHIHEPSSEDVEPLDVDTLLRIVGLERMVISDIVYTFVSRTGFDYAVGTEAKIVWFTPTHEENFTIKANGIWRMKFLGSLTLCGTNRGDTILFDGFKQIVSIPLIHPANDIQSGMMIRPIILAVALTDRLFASGSEDGTLLICGITINIRKSINIGCPIYSINIKYNIIVVATPTTVVCFTLKKKAQQWTVVNNLKQ